MQSARLDADRNRDGEPQSIVVGRPQPHEGVRRALVASFGQVPALPEEFRRLLNRLR
jgi:hypothetical protein